MEKNINDKKIIVVKLGRSIVTSKRSKIDTFRFNQLAEQIVLLQNHNMSIVFVVSGAVCCGEGELGLKGKYSLSKQLVGGVGQATFIAQLYAVFSKHKIKIAQLLITQSDLEDEDIRESITTVLRQAAEKNIVLIVNENDIVDLHSFGGNDYLATHIARLHSADTLLLLTDVAGVLNEDMQVMSTYKKGQRLAQITKINNKGSVGGMEGKINAALIGVNNGTHTWIANGKTQNILTRMLLQNEHIGTKIIGGVL